jgi:hypothetical protein
VGYDLRSSAWRLGARVGTLGPAHFDGLGPSRSQSVKLWQFPLSLEGGWVGHTGALEWEPSVGVTAVLLSVRGAGTDHPQSGSRLDVAAHLGFEFEIPVGAVFLGAGARMLFFPKTYEFISNGNELLVKSPSLWLVETLGLRYDF